LAIAPRDVQTIYRRLAPVYDLMYGVALRHGRRQAMARLAPESGESVLEVGVGTGLSALDYPPGCRVAAIDISGAMLERAQQRLARRGMAHVGLCRMDAGRLAFPDACFDAICAAYVMNVVPDPIQVAREMLRVCRPGGRIVLLNHFREPGSPDRPINHLIGRVATRATGASWQLELGALLRQTGLIPESIDRVNVPRVSSVVLCRKLLAP
jgi:phosphatidylethanolamine/phosphatidyl-N-methylethanolamine N-methyltransferase